MQEEAQLPPRHARRMESERQWSRRHLRIDASAFGAGWAVTKTCSAGHVRPKPPELAQHRPSYARRGSER